MSKIRLLWNSFMRLSELEFKPALPAEQEVSDEIALTISWLTGATNHDRKLIRCDENGAMLINNAWSLLSSVEVDELYPADGSPDTYVATVLNKGVLIATSTQIVKVGFIRVAGGSDENVYLPANCLYFFPNPTYSVTATVIPATGGTASYVGVTAFN